jgi:GDP-4-dehydro-6-deoxy-D-mannose reductase
MKYIVTGAGGFAGSHLCEYLRKKEHDVLALDLAEGKLSEVDEAFRPVFEPCDLGDYDRLLALVRDHSPDALFHLAAMSFVPEAKKHPGRAVEINITGSLHVLDILCRVDPGIRTVMVSSGEVYGRGRGAEAPYAETDPTRPENIYAMTKESMERFTAFFCRSHDLNAVILRPFNHIGPRQSDLFAVSSFTRQVAEMQVLDKEPVLRVGDLDAKRDFTDVRDMVAAYALAAENGRQGDAYNVCSGDPVRLKEIVSILQQESTRNIRIEIDQTRLRAGSGKTDVFFGDPARFVSRTKWRRHYTLAQSLKDTLRYWTDRLRAKASSAS